MFCSSEKWQLPCLGKPEKVQNVNRTTTKKFMLFGKNPIMQFLCLGTYHKYVVEKARQGSSSRHPVARL
jgi:hypothetical protein